MNEAKILETLRAANVKPDGGPWFNVTINVDDPSKPGKQIKDPASFRMTDGAKHPGPLGAMMLLGAWDQSALSDKDHNAIGAGMAGLKLCGFDTREQASSFACGFDNLREHASNGPTNGEAWALGRKVAEALK